MISVLLIFNVLIVSRKSILAGLHVFVLYNVILIFVIVHEVWHFNKIFIYLSIYLVSTLKHQELLACYRSYY